LQWTVTYNPASVVLMVNSSGTGTAGLSSMNVSFGNQPENTTSAPMTVTVTNTGTANLTIATAALGGTNVTDFAKTADTCTGATLAPSPAAGSTCSVSVTFTPATSGSLSGTLTFTDNSGGVAGSMQTATLSGTGTVPVASLSSPTLSFGNQPENNTSAPMTETVTNTGAANLTIATATLGGTNVTDFAKSADTCTGATLTPSPAAGSTCTVSVTFTPAATGPLSGTLTFTDNSNGVAGSTQTVTLSGTGTAPAVTFSTNPLPFGGVLVNTTSTLVETITNSGAANLQITNFFFSSGSPPFTITNGGTCDTDGQSLSAGASCTVNITFGPTAIGPFTGAFTITDNASGSPQSVTLTGTGTAPVAGAAPGSLTFSGQLVGTTSASQPVTLSNTGAAALTITNIAASANFGQTNTCAGNTVLAGSSCTINVTFTPTATGVLAGTLTITDNSNGVAGSTQTVTLSGTGTAPVAGAAPASLTFNSQTVGTTSTSQPVTLNNTLGTAALTIASIATSANFGQTNTCAGNTVAAGGSCTINVTFTPTAAGPLTGTLTITDNSNGVAGSTQIVNLNGTGTGVPLASLSSASLSFGSQSITTTSTAQTVTVTNTGTINLTIATATLGGTNVSDFTKTADTCTGATVAANGTCTVTVTFTPAVTGALSGTLTFTDNNNNVAGSTQAVTLSGTGVDFALALPTGTESVVQGGSATYTINVTSLGGTDSSAVTLACSNLPALTTCGFSTNPVTPGANGGSSTLTIATQAPVYARALPPSTGMPPAGLPALLLATMLLVMVAWWRAHRRSPRWATAACLLFGALLATTFMVGCGGGGYLLPKVGGTVTGSYTITITGTSGSTQHSTTITLNVTAPAP
jgi:hypothetical protein